MNSRDYSKYPCLVVQKLGNYGLLISNISFIHLQNYDLTYVEWYIVMGKNRELSFLRKGGGKWSYYETEQVSG